jgi:hypothetical protein
MWRQNVVRLLLKRGCLSHLYFNRQILLHRKHIVSITKASLSKLFGKTKDKLVRVGQEDVRRM